MAWPGRLVWIAVSLYGSYLIGRELLAHLRRKEQTSAFRGERVPLRLRVQLAGLWVLSSTAWSLLLAFTPSGGLVPLP